MWDGYKEGGLRSRYVLMYEAEDAGIDTNEYVQRGAKNVPPV